MVWLRGLGVSGSVSLGVRALGLWGGGLGV